MIVFFKQYDAEQILSIVFDNVNRQTSMGRMYYFLVTDVVVLVLQALSIVLNAIVLLALHKVNKNSISIYLVMYLANTNLFHAIAISFHTIYLVLNWNPTIIDMDPYVVMISIIPLPFQLKANIILTIAIAMDRVLALYAPLQYRAISLKKYAIIALITAILFGISDIVLEFWMSPIGRSVNCAAAGCFFSYQFRCYWGISNMVLGLLIIALTAAVLFRLRMHSRVSSLSHSNVLPKYAKASRSSVALLLSSLVCLMIPSVIVGGAQLFGFSLFDVVGPFYLVGLLCSDCMNCVIYGIFNSDIRNRLKHLVMNVGSNDLTSYVRKNLGNTATSTYT